MWEVIPCYFLYLFQNVEVSSVTLGRQITSLPCLPKFTLVIVTPPFSISLDLDVLGEGSCYRFQEREEVDGLLGCWR